MYIIDSHVAVAVAGITSDANILIQYLRKSAQQYLYTYNEPIPVEQLIQQVCDLKQVYTQSGGLRPFGVSFLFAGWDDNHGFQLYQSDPSGNYGGWKARAIGANHQQAQSTLKEEYKIDETSLDDALMLAIKVLSKTMDTTSPTPDKMEFATITKVDGKVVYHVLTKTELEVLLKKAETMLKAEAAKESATGDV